MKKSSALDEHKIGFRNVAFVILTAVMLFSCARVGKQIWRRI